MDDEFKDFEKEIGTSDNKRSYGLQIGRTLISNSGLNGVPPVIQFSENISMSDKIKAVKPYFNWSPLNPDVKMKYQKQNGISGVFRRIAKVCFDDYNFFEAVRFYNMAILYGEKDGPALKLVYVLRTFGLIYLSKAQEAQRCDPKSPRSNRQRSMPRLFWTKAATETTPEKNQSEEPSIMETGQCEADLEARNLFYRKTFTLISPNPTAPSLPDSIAIKWNESPRGRRLVANKNIPVGTTVLVERPFTAVLTDALAWDVNHCHHCFKKNIENIPCDNCVFTLYCSADCREKAQYYHQYECECLPELHCALDDVLWRSKFHLAFKLVCELGPKALFKQYKERKPGDPVGVFVSVQTQKQVFARIDGNAGSCDCESDSNESPTHKLVSRDISQGEYYIILVALTLARTLLGTDFSSAVPYNNKTEEEPEFQDFLAEFILCHFEAFWINALELHDFPENGRKTFRTHKSGTKGLLENIENSVTGAFATASLVNHSCVENVAIINGKSDGLMAMITIKPIVEGEELFISYNQRYNSKPFAEAWDRRQRLKTHFNFDCNCIACENDWPSIHLFQKEVPAFCCPKCSSTFQHEKKESPEFQECRLVIGAGDEDIHCKVCGALYVLSTQVYEYVKARDSLVKYRDELQNKGPPSQQSVNTTPDLIKDALMFFETSVCPPDYSCFVASELYKDFVNLTLKYADPKLK